MKPDQCGTDLTSEAALQAAVDSGRITQHDAEAVRRFASFLSEQVQNRDPHAP